MSSQTPSIADLVMTRRVIVCGGSGGVGKTTTATAIAIAAAQRGRKVLALTVDPSKRLAQTLGVDRNASAPTSISPERMAEAGIQAPGSLEAWMLDPSVVADRLIERLVTDTSEAHRLKGNRIYRQLSRLVAGTQEYMAMEALYRFLEEGRYDLIVLDTPPSRNALDFLLGPGRVAAFADGRIFQLFLPSDQQTGFFRAAAANIITRVNNAIFGEQTYGELQEFFATFAHIIVGINRNASQMLKTLQNPDEVAFLLVSSPAAEAMVEAFYFRRKCLEMELPFRGFVLNRSEARPDARVMPEASDFGASDPVLASALAKLQRLATLEMAQVERDRKLLSELTTELGEDAVAVAVPALANGAHDMDGLMHIATILMEQPAPAA